MEGEPLERPVESSVIAAESAADVAFLSPRGRGAGKEVCVSAGGLPTQLAREQRLGPAGAATRWRRLSAR